MASFSIEAPAEANPLTNESVYRVLQSASSSNQHQIQTGTKQLENWQRHPGFYSTLQSVYIDTSLPEEVRYLAILQLKNGIDKYWRKTAANAISKEEKSLIRSRCLECCLGEPSSWLALQAAIMTARVIRYEYPHDWPDAIPSIVESMHTASRASLITYRLPRSLLLLLYVVKELSTARLQRSRQQLQAAAPSIVAVLFSIYTERMQTWMTFLHNGGDDEGGALDSMEQSLLALRVLRRLVVQYDFPNRHQDLQKVWIVVNSHFGNMLALLSPEKASLLHMAPRAAIELHLMQISKLHLNMVKDHPAAFALLPDSIDLARVYWNFARRLSESYGLRSETLAVRISTDGDAGDEPPFQEKLTLKGLLILRAIDKMVFNPIQTFKYQQAEDKEEKKTAREAMQKGLLTERFAQEVMELLVTRFFVFTSRDLKQWEEEPDEWEKTQEGAGDDWEFSIRTCAEKLFLDLVLNYKEALIPPLLNVLQNAGSQDTNNVLGKDSVYAAIGIAAPILEQRFDFPAFLQYSLVPEVQVQKPGCNILRRRIAIVLGQWLPVKDGLDRSLVYQIFQYLLDKNDTSNDQVVRVTAGRQLHNVIDPFEFTAEGFVPYAPTILERLTSLIQEVELIETKMALLSTISLIVIKMEHHITPFADQIISLLPPLWEQAGDEYLMKQSILGILSALVTSLGVDSQKYHYLMTPLIQSSIDRDSEDRPFLLEDALDLWASIIEQTPSPAPPETASLVQQLVPNFDTGSDACRKALEITEAYIYLMPSEILSNASLLLEPFVVLLGTLKREASGMVTHLVELLLRSADHLGGEAAVREFTSPLVSSLFLKTILAGLREAFEAHQTTGPKRTLTSIDGVVETDYYSVIARLAVISPALLIAAFESTPEGSSVDWLLTEWFDHMDAVSNPTQKKLNTLALTALLEIDGEMMLARLQNLMSLWTDVITELVIEDVDGAGNNIKRDCLVYSSPDAFKPEGIPDSPAAYRQRQITFADPVHRIDIRDFVRQKLGTVIERCGGMDRFRQQWVENVDKDVVQAFGALGIF